MARPEPDTSPAEQPPGRLTVTADRRGGWTAIALEGDLDLTTLPVLETRLRTAADEHSPPRLALDLSDLNFCDSSGLNAIVRAWQQSVAADGELILLNPQDRVLNSLKMTGLHERLPIHGTLPE
jgi:anti-anti-sigma factor